MSAPAIAEPRASHSTPRRRGVNLEKWGWVYMRASGMVLVVLIWVSTAALQVPAHKGLTQGFAERAHRRLVATNWLRTVLWSVRGVLACVLIATA